MKMLAVFLVSVLLVSAQAEKPDLDKIHEQLKEEFQKTVEEIKNAIDQGSIRVLALIDRAHMILKKLEKENLLDTVKESLHKLEEQVRRIVKILTGRDEDEKIAHPRLRSRVDEERRTLKELLEDLEDRIRKARESIAAKWDELKAKVRQGREKQIEMVKELLDNIEKFSKETLQKALDILEPFKQELGNWYNQLEQKVRQLTH